MENRGERSCQKEHTLHVGYVDVFRERHVHFRKGKVQILVRNPRVHVEKLQRLLNMIITLKQRPSSVGKNCFLFLPRTVQLSDEGKRRRNQIGSACNP